MPNSYLVIGILAVVGIILSLIWMRNATFKSGQVEKIEEDESYKWAKKWNEQRETEDEVIINCLQYGVIIVVIYVITEVNVLLQRWQNE